YGHEPIIVSVGAEGEDPMVSHARFAEALDHALDRIARIKADAAAGTLQQRPAWPMIVLRSPKGWTCPDEVDGKAIEGTWRAHQVPLDGVRDNVEHRRLLE